MINSGAEQLSYEVSQTIGSAAHSGVLGLSVVRLAGQINGSRPDVGGTTPELLEFDESLQAVRDQLGAMTEEEQARFGPYVRMLMADRLPDARADDADVVTHLVAAHDAQIVTFLSRNVHMVERQQANGQPFFWVAKIRYAHDTAKGIDERWISEDARGFEGRMWRRPVRVGDFAMTHQLGAAGFVDLRRGGQIIIGQGVGPTEEACMRNLQANTYQTFDHEQNHAGFEDKFTEDYREVVTWFIEAMAEHLSVAKKYGHPDVLSPAERQEAAIDSGIYAPLRDFVDFVASEAPFGPVRPAVLTRGYTARWLNSPDWVEMEEQLDAAWRADGAFWAIGRKFREHWKEIRQAEPKMSWEQQYYAAADRTRQDLEQNPRLVFGPAWQEPRRQDGSAVRAA